MTSERLSSADEGAYIEAARHGDRDAFDVLARKCFDKVTAAALRAQRQRRWVDYEDLVQETFETAFKKLSNYDGRSSVCLWMIGIVKNKSRNNWRKRTRRQEDHADELDVSVGGKSVLPSHAHQHTPEASTDLDAIRSLVIESLPDEYWELFVLRFHMGLSYEEISRELPIAEGTVGSRLNQIRQVIRHAKESGLL